MSPGFCMRRMRPRSSRTLTILDSMVGFRPSSSVSSVRPRGPRPRTRARTEYWVGVRSSPVDVSLSTRASLGMTARSRATSSVSITSPDSTCMLASKQLTLLHVSLTGETARTSEPARDAPGARQKDRRKLIFAIVSIGLFMASVDQTIVATALPAIEKELHAGINWSGWTISIYALGQVIAMPMAGKISDMYGRKKVFMVSAAVFTLASLCCGFAPNITLLLIARFIQALGGGAFMPSATGIVSDHFGDQRDRAVGMFTSIFPIGGIIGPVLGGLFVSYWSWRGIFLVNVPIGVILIILTARFIPVSATRPTTRIDIAGVLLLAGLLTTAMFGITFLGTGSAQFYDPVFLVSEAAAVALGFLFVRHAKTARDPFVSYRLLRGHGFGSMNVINYLK